MRLATIVVALSLTSITFAADVQKLDTKSGFSAVYLIEDNNQNQVRAELIIHAGEYDWKGPEGGPHYLEHLVYWHASKDVTKKYTYEKGGAHINGFATHYLRSAPAEHLAETLNFVARVFTTPELSQQFMIEERNIVEREFDLRQSENPFAAAYDKLKFKFYGNHPLSRSVGGTLKSIRANVPAKLFDYHKKFYVPANATLLVIGNISAKNLSAAISRQFTGLQAGVRDGRLWRQNIPMAQELQQIEFMHERIKSEEVIDFRHMISPKNWSFEKTHAVLGLLGEILTSTNKGTLAKKLRYDEFLAESLFVRFAFLPNGEQILQFSAKPDEDVSLAQLSGAYNDTLIKIGENGIPTKTFERMHKAMLATEKRLKGDFDSVVKRTRNAISLGFEPQLFGNYYDELEAITRNDINQYLKEFLVKRRRITMFVRPMEE